MCFAQVAGGRNVPPAVQKVAKASIDQSRQMKYQSFNEYRKRFYLKPYESFEELTGKKQNPGPSGDLEPLEAH